MIGHVILHPFDGINPHLFAFRASRSSKNIERKRAFQGGSAAPSEDTADEVNEIE